MSQEILVNVTPGEVRIALLEKGILQELHIERSIHQGLLGNIYKGRVSRLLPGIQAAFVDIGLDRSAFLHISDIKGLSEATDLAQLDIANYLTPGKEILVQVYKDPLGSKGARITMCFTIASRCLVFTPDTFNVAVSQRITDEAERERLLAMLVPSNKGGYIFRTAAEHANQAEIEADKLFLDTLWADVSERSLLTKSAKLVYEEIPIVLRVLRDLVGFDIEKIRVDHDESVEQMRKFAEKYLPNLANRIEFYDKEKPIFDLYSVESELQKALERNIPLKSGGHLVFDQTEAMTTIDINTGSYVGNNNYEQTIFRTNLEAIEVIARQIRLRNLGGIIIIDFIDMIEPANKDQLLQALAKALETDNARIQISELSSLGLVQLTRKRTRESLEHILCIPCPTCQQRGSIKSRKTICYEICREVQRLSADHSWPGFIVTASPLVIEELLQNESALLAETEVKMAKSIKLQVNNTYPQERFDIIALPKT